MTTRTETIGAYAEPAVIERYLVKVFDWPQDPYFFGGRAVERTAQKLENGGWHYLEIDIHTCESREWFSVPVEGNNCRRKLVLI